MANFLKNLGAKVKSAAGRTVDLAGRGALYSQMMNDPSANMSMSQRLGGAVSKGVIDATLGNMGTLGQALGAGLEARGRRNAPKESPTGTDGVGGSNIPFKPIKTENVVQAINQSTQQMLSGLNTLNATFRMGLNATANQMQAQVSIISSLKRDTEDMVIGLREIYEVLNKMGYQGKGKLGEASSGSSIMGDGAITPGSSNSLLGNILTGLLAEKLLGNALPDSVGKDNKTQTRNTKNPRGSLLKRGLGALKSLKGLSITSLLGGLALDYGSDYAKESGYEKTGAGLSIMSSVLSGAGMGGMAGALAGGGIGSIPLGLIGAIGGGAAGLGYGLYNEGSELFGIGKDDLSSVPTATTTGRTQSNVIAKEAPSPNISEPAYNPNRSRAQAIQQGLTAGTELNTQEIDALFKAAPPNLSDNGLLALAQKMFPGRKYNTLKNRMQQLHMMMQPGPQSALESGVKVASAGTLSSGDYLVNRQKMLDSQNDQTSESKLRAKEQEYEQAVKDILQTIKYEARDVLFEADNIKFAASKIEFTEGGEGTYGSGGGYGPGGPNGPGGPGGGGGDDTGVTRIPELSAETKAAAEQLQSSNVYRVAPGSDDALGQYSEEQLRSQGIVSHTNTDGTKVYTYAPGGIGSHADKIGGSGATQSVAQPGQYRPVYAGIEGDIADEDLINIIGNEARNTDESIDAVINNMMNRLGSSSYGNAQSLSEVAKQKGQYESWDFLQSGRFKPVDKARAEKIKERLRAVASGSVPDTTGGANEFRARSYLEGEGRGKTFDRTARSQGFRDVGGNVYANTGFVAGPYAAYPEGQAPTGQASGPTAVAPNLAAGLQGMQPANAPAVAGVGPGNIAVKEAYGPRRPDRPDESIRNIGSAAGAAAGMSAITFTSGKGDWISEAGRAKGQTFTWHQTGKALDVSGFSSDEERLRFIEEAAARGANGVGVYKDGSIHIDQRDDASTWSWGGINKKMVDAAVKRGKKKREQVLAEEKKKKEDAEKQKKNVETKIQVKEESGLEKTAASRFGVTPESKQRMVEQNKANLAATTPPPGVATPAQLDPTAVQASQKVSELSKKTTMNRETAPYKQGPVTQNIVNNNKTTADSTGNDAYDKNSPYPAMGGTMQKYVAMYFGDSKQTAAV